VPLHVDTAALFLRTLAAHTSQMTPELHEQFRQIQAGYLQSYPKMLGLIAGVDQPASFPPDVEEEANAYFQKIYTNQLSIDDTVALLQKFKNSSNPREQEVFACMIHNLFDEYRFFGRYPDKELMITGTLFGALIQHQLVSYIPLGIALRYVLEGRRPARVA